MLDRSGDSRSNVQAGPHGGAGLADLVFARNIARVNGCARGAYFAAHQIGQLADQIELILTVYPRAACHDHRRVFQPDSRFAHFAAQHLQGEILRLENRCDVFDTALARGIAFATAHHTFAHGRHLRARLRVDDGGNNVAAKRRPDLVEQVFINCIFLLENIFADLQIGAVGGQAHFEGAGNARSQIAADGRCAD